MKVGIMSDSHGLTSEVEKIKERHQAEVDVFIHCGDSELEKADSIMEGLLAVRGNCDYDADYPDYVVETIGDSRFLVTHGHLYNVKMTVMNLSYKAEEEQADIICFGHSHIAGSEMIDGRLYINPGSIRLPRNRKEKTYAILELHQKEATIQFYDDCGNLVKNLRNTYTFN
ncbi:metallophosphoesterase [Peribacillus loiseleuriae]|uniref:Phosphoesterase n=1 Tax=Peribacillus loiseleuriae TaxID=1679170 RepID=A0A0K9GWZ8_9BACI|nr:metallophosphoesterase [Peribacillus loiseleuriae]KMY51151.1 metallophosphatase [Peribacillus loiseleuriae]